MSFTSSFPIWISFISFSFLMLWLRLPKLYWILVRVGNLLWLLIFFFQFFAIEENVCYGFVIYGLYCVEICLLMSFYAYFLESFYHKWMLNFVKGFFCIYWNDHMAFIFQYVNIVYRIDWFAYIEESLHPWDKGHLVMLYDLFNMLLDLFARILLRIFVCMSISDIIQ